MYKVGICAHFGKGKNLLNGQTIKSKIIAEELRQEFKAQNVLTVDTYNWKANPISLVKKCFLLIKNSKNVIILPAKNGLKILVPLFFLLNKIFRRKLHYIVIGGWLPDLLKNNIRLKKFLKNFDGIYVETKDMVHTLNLFGLENIYYLPNFKNFNVVSENELVYQNEEPYKLCTFSRVMKEKGVEDAIEAVKRANTKLKRVAYTLDIYGQIEKGYEERFEQLKLDFPSYISYRGSVPFNETIKVLKNYYALLFPTSYEGEGFPGTIIDAFSAGVPVIATNWKYNSEIITHKKNGIIYNNGREKLSDILINLTSVPENLLLMKKNCIVEANKYNAKNVMKTFINKLEL